jgi:hypothetical protein
MEIKRVGVDLAKNVFQVHGVNGHEKPVWKRSLRRGQWLAAIQRHVGPGAEIGMEACATRPELVATAPNSAWSWDITKLRMTVCCTPTAERR